MNQILNYPKKMLETLGLHSITEILPSVALHTSANAALSYFYKNYEDK